MKLGWISFVSFEVEWFGDDEGFGVVFCCKFNG